VHMIKFTERREIIPYLWVHPDEERRGALGAIEMHGATKRRALRDYSPGGV
jgi:hypothetical protein